MRRKFKQIGLFGAMAVGATLATENFDLEDITPSSLNNPEMSYSDFLNQIQDRNISSIVANGNELTVLKRAPVSFPPPPQIIDGKITLLDFTLAPEPETKFNVTMADEDTILNLAKKSPEDFKNVDISFSNYKKEI